ncbi:dNTP triphosphohydrolase [Flavobacteriaceae bacterium]|nr:dNTP triphosphohydrolase [Flavobacteriaceae bacterium]MDB4152060.1 dNTP triphosphohydrolase [Flavobacteriaceae bacterium]|tara:strand:+ start:1182 stop:2501 length:1320 start_codon:yes stop_codon:yes gene_type:complete
MNWEQLLSLQRYGDKTKRLRKEQDETRLGFEVDYDRIVFSAAFRSLQDKTQVIPFSKTDFVHTRLTHSLEVSVVARSIGRLAGKAILEKHPHLSEIHAYQSNDFGAIVAAAALAHDIGNPPFGHSGEKAIGHFFSDGSGAGYKAELNALEYEDLCKFEGNANGFKIVSQSMEGAPGGLRLSAATLGAYMKYPKASLPHKPTQHVADKKFGFYQAQATDFSTLAQDLGLASTKGTYFRHPLAYLVEAADDICYTIIDFEDGINLGWISESYALEYLINLVKDSIDKKTYASLKHTPQRMSYLRALAINSLIKDAVAIFLKNEEAILSGSFPHALLDKSKYAAQIDDIISLSVEKVYHSPEVLQKEIVGYKVITTLLDAFTTAAVHEFKGEADAYDQLILRLVPKGTPFLSDSLYDTLLNATCYVASLSDGKAMELSKKMK